MDILGFIVPLYGIWAIVAIIFLLAEFLTTALVSVWFIPGCILAMLISFMTDNIMVQLVVFIVTTIVCFVWFRRIYIDRIKVKPEQNAIIGKTGTAITEISELSGRVKIGDVNWNAKILEGEIINSNSIVRVVDIDNVTLIVAPINVNT